MAAAQFRLELVNISKKLGPKEIEHIKFVYEDTIPKGKLETIDNGIKLMRALEEHGIVKETDGIDKIKERIFHDILQVPNEEDKQSMKQFREQDYIYLQFFDYISERIATVFEKLGRYLGISNQQIDLILTDNITYYDVKKKAYEILKYCHESREKGLQWQELKQGLIYCKRWDVIREAEKNTRFKNITAFLGYQFDGNEQLLDRLCDKVSWKWELIGAFLCIEFADIETVREDQINSKDKIRAIFDCKIQSQFGLRWPLINRALKCVNENRLINEIKREFPHITNENVNDEELEKPNWTYFIAYLSKEVSSFWKDLGRQLKVNVDNIDKDTNYRKTESKAFAVLREAYEGELQLDWNILSDALKNCRRHDVLRKVNMKKEFSHLMR